MSKLFKCSLCDYRATLKTNFDRHIESSKHQKRQQDCNISESSFLTETTETTETNSIIGTLGNDLEGLTSVTTCSSSSSKPYKYKKRLSKQEIMDKEIELYKLKLKCLELERGLVPSQQPLQEKQKQNIQLIIEDDIQEQKQQKQQQQQQQEEEEEEDEHEEIKPIEYDDFLKNINEYLKENKYINKIENKNETIYCIDLRTHFDSKNPYLLHEKIITDLFNKIDKHLLPIRCIDSKRKKFKIYDGTNFVNIDETQYFTTLNRAIWTFVFNCCRVNKLKEKMYESDLYKLGYYCGNGELSTDTILVMSSQITYNDFIKLLSKVCKY